MIYELHPAVPADRMYMVTRLTCGLSRQSAFDGMQGQQALRAAYALATALTRAADVAMVAVPGLARAGLLVTAQDPQGPILHWLELERAVRRRGIARQIVTALTVTPLRVTSRTGAFRELVHRYIGRDRVVYTPWPLFRLAGEVDLDLASASAHHKRVFRQVELTALAERNIEVGP